MAARTEKLASFENDTFSLSVTYDDVTGVIASVTVVNGFAGSVSLTMGNGTTSRSHAFPTGTSTWNIPISIKVTVDGLANLVWSSP